MTVRVALSAVTVIPMLCIFGLSSCQPTGGGIGGSGGRTDGTGGSLGSGGRGSGGSAVSSGNGGSLGQGGSQPGVGGVGAGGRGGTLGNGGNSGKDAGAKGGANGGSTLSGGQGGGSGGKDAGSSQGDAGPVACDDIQSPGRLGVYFYDDAAVNGQSVQMHLDIVNYTAFGSRLSQVTLRYWFTDEDTTTANVVEQYYVPIPTKMKFSPVSPPRVGADTVLEMSFSDSPDAAASWVETRGFNFAFHKNGYSGTYDQSNDYSYDAKLTKTLGPNPKIAAYVNGVLAWGCEPPVQSVVQPPAIDASAGSPTLDAPAPPPVDGGP